MLTSGYVKKGDVKNGVTVNWTVYLKTNGWRDSELDGTSQDEWRDSELTDEWRDNGSKDDW